MKKTLALLLALLMLLAALPAAAQGSKLPLYEVYPVNAGENIWFEVSTRYEAFETPGSFPVIGVIDPEATNIMAANAVFACIPEGLVIRPGDMDVRGFAQEGRAVLAGTENTGSSRVIERYEINDLPAVRVEMLGQGYEMIWVGDDGDMYFFMYPTADSTFAQDMRDMAATLHLVSANTLARCDAADYEYTADDEGVTITGYTGDAVRVAIPEAIDGKPVVALGEMAFYETDVTWLSIPDSVTTIGRYCFGGCTLLQTLRLPASLTEIPDGMLESCFRLLALDIPEGVKSIGSGVFWGNFYLETLHLPASLETLGGFNFVNEELLERFTVAEGNTAFKTLDDGAVLLSADGKRLIRYCGWQERASYTIPEGVEVIDSFAFADWGQLRNVIVPEGVVTIEGSAFIGLRGLQSLTLPASAVNLGVLNPEKMGSVAISPLSAESEESAAQQGGTASICGDVVIIAPEGSAAQAYAEQFNLIFEAAQSAEDILQE